MEKNLFILFFSIFLFLSILLFWKSNIVENEKNGITIAQAEKTSTNQVLNIEIETKTSNETSSLQTSFQDTRKKDIQERIENLGKNEIGIPVLMYHFFYNSSSNENELDNNFLEISKFEEQLKYLKENDFFFPTFEELSSFINGTIELPKKSVILTIDDGNPTFFSLAAPVIEKYQIPVTSFVITSNCDIQAIEQYRSNYIHFESHSDDLHKAGKNGKGLFVNLSYEKASEDIKKSICLLNSKEAFCYPFGHYNDTAKQVLRDLGYKVAFTTKGGKVKKGMDPLELPRVRILKDDSLSSFISKVKN